MILTCPECATRFSTKAEAIGPNGRTVRCSQCSTTWFAAADPDILSLNEIQASELENQLNQQPEPAHEQDIETETSFGDDAPSDTPPVSEDLAPHAAIRDKADKQRVRRRLFGVSMIWIVTLAILILAALFAWAFRSQIVAKFPATQQFYGAFGVKASESGLEIFGVETRQGESDGTPVLFVNGTIKNYDLKTRDLPLIKMSFKNSNGEVLTSWVIEPSKSSLGAGKTLTFASQYPNPPIDAVKLAPSLVEENGGLVENVPMVSQ